MVFTSSVIVKQGEEEEEEEEKESGNLKDKTTTLSRWYAQNECFFEGHSPKWD